MLAYQRVFIMVMTNSGILIGKPSILMGLKIVIQWDINGIYPLVI